MIVRMREKKEKREEGGKQINFGALSRLTQKKFSSNSFLSLRRIPLRKRGKKGRERTKGRREENRTYC